MPRINKIDLKIVFLGKNDLKFKTKYNKNINTAKCKVMKYKIGRRCYAFEKQLN